jgi:hypothetical protein
MPPRIYTFNKSKYLLLLPNEASGEPCTKCRGNGDWFDKKKRDQVKEEIELLSAAITDFDSTYSTVSRQ